MDEDVFGAATDVENFCAVEGLEVAGLVGEDGAGALDLDRVDLRVCGGFAEAADYGVYFWELWHGASITIVL